MIYDKINFEGFSVNNPEQVLRSQTQNRRSFYDLSWYPVIEPEIDLSLISVTKRPVTWLNDNCEGEWQVVEPFPRKIYVFKNENDAVLFKLAMC